MKGYLLLENGELLQGRLIGHDGISHGEIVFHTGMTGYQEIITDPSYCGQIVVMTYPHIGNYGVNLQDVESQRPFLPDLSCENTRNIPATGDQRNPCKIIFGKTRSWPSIKSILGKLQDSFERRVR